MTEGMTCYERDETLCEDQMCLRVGCRIRNERLSPPSSSQPKGETLPERLRTMPSSLNDACRTMDEAAERVEELEKAIELARYALRKASLTDNERIVDAQIALNRAVLEPKGAAV